MKIVVGLMLSALSGAVMGSNPPVDGRHPEDDGRTRIVQTDRYGILRRKPLPQCIQDRIRNRTYFPAGDYTEEARRACERYYREHPELRPPGWRSRDDSLATVTEKEKETETESTDSTIGGIMSGEESEGTGEETDVLGSVSLDLNKGSSRLLDTLGLQLEDLHFCCPLSENMDVKSTRKSPKLHENSSSFPAASQTPASIVHVRGGNGYPRLGKVSHKDPQPGGLSPKPLKPIYDAPLSGSDDSEDAGGVRRGSSDDYYRDRSASSLPPPTPCSSPIPTRRPISLIKRLLTSKLRRKNGML